MWICIFVLWFVALAVFIPMVSRLATPERLSNIADKINAEVDTNFDINQITQIGNILWSGEFISINNAGIESNKNGILFEDENDVVVVNIDGSCDEFFAQNKAWVSIIKDWLCVIDGQGGWNRFVSVSEIMSGRSMLSNYIDTLWKWLPEVISSYPSINSILRDDGIYLDSNNIWSIITSEIPNIIKDKAFIFVMLDQIKSIFPMFSILAIFGWIFGSFLFAFIILCLLLLYTFITWVVWSFFAHPGLDYNKSFSISWLPFMIFCVLMWFVTYNIVLFILAIIWLFYRYKTEYNKWSGYTDQNNKSEINRSGIKDDLSDLSNK